MIGGRGKSRNLSGVTLEEKEEDNRAMDREQKAQSTSKAQGSGEGHLTINPRGNFWEEGGVGITAREGVG